MTEKRCLYFESKILKAKHFKGLSIFIGLLLLTACTKNDAEISWSEQNSNTNYLLSSVHFLNELEGYAVGGDSWFYGLALHTQDGGTTWETDSLYNNILWGLQADRNQNLYATGVNSIILNLEKDSTNWTLNTMPFWEIMRDIAFFDKKNGVLVGGEAFQSGYIARITDNFQVDTFIETDYELSAVCFSDSNIVHAVGYGTILKSTDAGRTWSKNAILNDYFRSVHFPSPQVGYAVGATGTIIKSTDAGETWDVLRDGDDLLVSDIPFQSVFFVNENKGYIVGDKGVFWCTKNGGKDWQVVSDLPKLNLYDVFGVNDKGWIVGENGLIISFEL